VAWLMRAVGSSALGRRIESTSAIRSPNTVPLPAAGGHDALLGLAIEVFDAARVLTAAARPPIDRDRLDLLDRLDQPLVAQITEHQQLRCGA